VPAMNGAQALGCSPVAQAYEAGQDFCRPVKPDTIAKSLAIGNPADGPYAIELANRTNGGIDSVTDEEIKAGIRLLAETTGIFTETAGGVTTATLAKLAERGPCSQKRRLGGESFSLSPFLTGRGNSSQRQAEGGDGVAGAVAVVVLGAIADHAGLRLGQRSGGDTVRATEKEGERMLAALTNNAANNMGSNPYVVALQVGGKALTTEQLAQFLQSRAHDGRNLAFCIGGPEGIAPAVDARADFRWSLSPLTLPHALVRVIVAEALYRAVSVIKNHPYHRA